MDDEIIKRDALIYVLLEELSRVQTENARAKKCNEYTYGFDESGSAFKFVHIGSGKGFTVSRPYIVKIIFSSYDDYHIHKYGLPGEWDEKTIDFMNNNPASHLYDKIPNINDFDIIEYIICGADEPEHSISVQDYQERICVMISLKKECHSYEVSYKPAFYFVPYYNVQYEPCTLMCIDNAQEMILELIEKAQSISMRLLKKR